MQWIVPELPERALVILAAAGIVAATVGIVRSSKHHYLNAFPTVGSGGLWGGIKFMVKSTDLAREGYRKYKRAPFKVSTLHYWAVVLSSREHIEEVRGARDEDFSFLEPTYEDLNSEYTMGPEVHDRPCHISLIRLNLTRHLDVIYPEMLDEIIESFHKIFDLKDNEWKSIPTMDAIQQIVSRTSNRAFVGLPLCRNDDFVNLNIEFTLNSILDGTIISFFPKVLKPIVARFVTNVSKSVRRGVSHLRPIVEERRKCLKEYGKNWADKPSDLLSWLMDELGVDVTVESCTNYLLQTNFAAIHTSSNVFANALYNLAANPQYMQPLREEAEAVLEEEGWSRTSLSKMYKIDSFLKETMRMEMIVTYGLARKVGRDYTFADGTFLPKGSRVFTPVIALHHDEALYESPEVFNPFRFVDMDEGNKENVKHQLVGTCPEYLAFGHGRHACPGRHFAALELKTMLVHVVTTYDIKLENGIRPPSFCFGTALAADPKAKLLFRKRVLPEQRN